MNQWLPVLGVIATCLGGYLSVRLSARAESKKRDAESRKMDAEARKIAAEEAGIVAANQREILSGWSTELKERDRRVARQEQHIAKLEEKVDHLEDLEKQLIREKEAAFEQSDLLAEQLEEERKANRLLAAQLETTRAQLDAAIAELAIAREELTVEKQRNVILNQQNAILIEHAHQTAEFWEQHFLHGNGHHDPNDKPPPTLIPFDDSDETNQFPG